ncbi:MAG: glycosyl transferase family 1 [Chloroflexota bacterium]|nr:MAG: glycosyl transferase family 1 [Chloroflexota bacterium]
MRVALNGLFLREPATGTGQYLRELVAALRALAAEDEFTFIAPRAHADAPAPVLVASTRARRENLSKLEFEQWTFPRAARENHFDLAHVPHWGAPLFSKIPTVVTIHDLIPLALPAYRGATRVRLYTKLVSAAAQRARAVLADSEASARDIEKYLRLPRAKIHVVHLAAHSRFHAAIPASELTRVRAKYALPEQFVLYLGGFDARKNVARLIEAFAGLQTGDWYLTLAGKLPNHDSAFFPDPRRLVAERRLANRVVFPGFIAEADKPALYALARVFLYASEYEGFGLPPLEALACGTPVICANTSSLPEVVGDAGILLAPTDTDAWRDALRTTLTQETQWARLRALGLAQARKFSWARAARETLAVYRAVV